MKQRPLALLGAIFVLGLLVMGCSRGAQSRGWAAPVDTDDNALLVSTSKGHLDGLEGSDRAREWRFPNDWQIPDKSAKGLQGIYGSPVLSRDGNTVFVGDYNGFVYAFHPDDKQASNTDKPTAASLKLDGPVIGGLALDESSGQIYATSGKNVFKFQSSELEGRISNRDAHVNLSLLFAAGDNIWSEPIVDSGRVYFASLDGNVYAIDTNSGNEIWRHSVGKPLVSVSIEGSTLFAGGFDNEIVALNLVSGEPKWTFSTSNWVWGRPATDSNLAYFGDFDSNVYALSLSNGSSAWDLNLGHGVVRAAPVVSQGTLVVATEDGWLIGVDLSSHEKRWEKDIDSAVRADLVLANDGSVLLAPSGCVTPKDSSEKLYYTSVDPASGDLKSATGVC